MLVRRQTSKRISWNNLAAKQRSKSKKKIEEINVSDYKVLVLPGGVKAMEKVRQNKLIIDFISKFNQEKK